MTSSVVAVTLNESNVTSKFVEANYISILGTGILGGIGVPGNALLMYLILPKFNKRKEYEWLIFNSTLIDFMLCLNGIGLQAPFSIIDNPTMCKFAGFVNTFFTLNSLVSVIHIPFNRYVSLYQCTNYNTIFTGKNIFTFITVQWLVIFLPGIPVIINGDLGIDEQVGICSVKRTTFETIALIFFTSVTITVYVLAVYCTVKVVQNIRQHKLHFQTSKVQSRVVQESSQLITVNILLLIIPCFTQLPYLLIRLVQIGSHINPWISRVFIAPNLLTSACNPYLSLFAIKQYKESVKRLFGVKSNQIKPVYIQVIAYIQK